MKILTYDYERFKYASKTKPMTNLFNVVKRREQKLNLYEKEKFFSFFLLLLLALQPTGVAFTGTTFLLT